ncbi:hypothetical protein D3C85_1482050 [compost metagenome]
MHHAEQIFLFFTAGDDHAGVLVFIQQGADLRFRRVQVDMLDIVARCHDAANRALIKIKHTLNHPPLLRVKYLAIIVVGKQ